MNVKRFSGRTSREAMQKVRQAFGDNAVVLSTQPAAGGVEILAMAPESVAAIERFQTRPAEPDLRTMAPAAEAPAPAAPRRKSPLSALRQAIQPGPATPSAPMTEPVMDGPVQEDVRTLAMSTLSFQDYVRERMLKKREAELRVQASQASLPEAVESRLSQREALRSAEGAATPALADLLSPMAGTIPMLTEEVAPAAAEPARPAQARNKLRLAEPAMDSEAAELPAAQPTRKARPQPVAAVAPVASESSTPAADADVMMRELRAMKGLIEERFGALAFTERLKRSPKQAQLTTRLIDCGFSPALVRKLADSLSEDVSDEIAWAAEVLQRNLSTGEADAPIEDQGGVYALVGSTGVGKTTSTAKLAAAFATRHGAGNLGLITLDAYRLGAHEQLRAYGRILGVPVHTAHDRVALDDLLDLLSAKKMVLIDTAGLAQRDSRTRELMDMLSHPSVRRLLVVNAAAQGETIDDVLTAYKASSARGVILSKLDEAVKLGPALDAMIRHRLKVVAVANGQRVPEDWHRLTSQALVHRALRCGGAQAWRMDSDDVHLMFSGSGRETTKRSRRPAAPAPSRLL